jgi:hypothetical protein
MSSSIRHSLNGLFVKYRVYKISAIALLLPKLMSGEIRVKEAEKIVEDVA